jgi:D-arginine dehydrogenase
MRSADVLVIGAGIAGASVAYELAARARVLVLEREDQPGYHSTGRSAALYTETYGNAAMRALTSASREFLIAPPAGFAAVPLLTPRGTLLVARAERQLRLEAVHAECSALVGGLELWDGAAVRERVPAFTADQVAAALWEPAAMDIDVHALHHGYLRGLHERGGTLICRAEVQALAHDGTRWRLETRAGEFAAPVVVNAAGAWTDEIARLAGAAPIGLVPKRRTAITFDPPAGLASHDWPAVCDVDEQWYFKPEAGRLLASPADETPSPPCDTQPDDYDVAVLVERLMQATALTVPRICSRWAGLRSFVADKTIVLGFDPQAEGFFWLAGQGGYGIQTAPAVAQAAAGLIAGQGWPAALTALRLDAAAVAPVRLRGR